MLNAKNQKGLAAQAMHELGNLHYHAGNIRYDCRNYVIYLSILFLTIYLEFINFLHDTEL